MQLRLSHVILFTANTDTMSAFYRDVLGLEPKTSERGWKTFDAGIARSRCIAAAAGRVRDRPRSTSRTRPRPGAVGDATRLEYTVIGDAANLLANLEKHNEAQGCRALALKETHDAALAQGYRPQVQHRMLSGVAVGGVAAPLDLVVVAQAARCASNRPVADGDAPALDFPPISGGGTSLRRIIERQLIADWGRLFGYAMTLAGDADTARDLLQQCAVQSLSSASPPRSEQSVRPWLFRILRNLWIDQYRRSRVRDTEPAVAAAAVAEQERWHYDDRLIAELTVQEGLARIEPMHREIIRLVDLIGFRYAEVAEILDIPLGTVMSRLSRARLALLDAIGGNVRSLEAARRRLS